MPLKGNPNAVGNNQKSFSDGKPMSFGRDNNPTGQMPDGSVNLNIMDFDRVNGTTGKPAAKEFSTPSSSGSGFEAKSRNMATSPAKPGVVKIGPIVRSNPNG